MSVPAKVCVVASTNPVKAGSIITALKLVFPDQQFDFKQVAASSDVSEQPFGEEETIRGARNRIKNARLAIPDADFYCGLEGGCATREKTMYCFAWIVIESGDGLEGKAQTCTFDLPQCVADLVRGGMELGHANDRIFSLHNSKQSGGAVGSLTGGLINRQAYYEQAAILALIPFRNRNLFAATQPSCA